MENIDELVRVAANGELGAVETLLNADASLVNGFGTEGSTALHQAAYWGRADTVALLLARGADPNAAMRDDSLQVRPLGCAVATPEVPNPSDDEAVVLELVRMLIESFADVNGRRRDGLTALHGAAFRGHGRVVAYLLDHGADRSLRGFDGKGPHAGQTALDIANAQGMDEAARLLRGH
jgi:ankyrin repeat protein